MLHLVDYCPFITANQLAQMEQEWGGHGSAGLKSHFAWVFKNRVLIKMVSEGVYRGGTGHMGDKESGNTPLLSCLLLACYPAIDPSCNQMTNRPLSPIIPRTAPTLLSNANRGG